MRELLEDLDLLLAPPPDGVRELYDRVAPQYDRFPALWLRLAGAPAEGVMLDDLKATLRPGQRVLDAGCGTGALARQIRELEPQAVVTMLDLSPSMLELAADVPGTHVVGDVAELPFLDDYFDVIVSAWVIETVPDPMRAVGEYLRVLSPRGYLFYTFSSLPEAGFRGPARAALRAIVENRFAGTFLPPEKTPWHDCDRSHRVRFHGGLTTEIALRKCCTVAPAIVEAAEDSLREEVISKGCKRIRLGGILSGMNEIRYRVPGMHCASCTAAVEQLAGVRGVESVSADLETKLVTLRGESLGDEALRAAIDEAGYEAE